MQRRSAFWRALTASMALLGMVATARAKQTDYDVKAAMLMNFALYVERVDAAQKAYASFQICHIAPESFDTALSKLKGRTVKNRLIEGRAVRAERDMEGCDMLFVGDARRPGIDRLIAVAHTEKVLTVLDGDGPGVGSANKPVCIQLLQEDRRIIFNVDLDAARDSGHAISSRLLKLAKHVAGNRPGQ